MGEGVRTLTLWQDLEQIIREECGDHAPRVLSRIRIICGGMRLYVPAKQPMEVTQKDTPKTLQAKYGVSRSTAYNWLNKYRL